MALTRNCYECAGVATLPTLKTEKRMKEIWKPIEGHDGYEVSSLGRVKSFAKNRDGKILKPGLTSVGYPSVVLRRGNTKMVHSLVAEAFLGPRPKGYDVCHVDGSRDNNCVENLKYGSRSENNIDASVHGRRKITTEDVIAIRDSSLTQKELARIYNISESQIGNVVNRRHWRHV